MRLAPYAAALALSLASSFAAAEPLPARETADVLPPKSFEIGVFSPARIGLPHVELEVHPLAALVAPHVDARFWLRRPASLGDVRFSWVLGLAVPTPALRLAKPLGLAGDLVPSCKVAAVEPNAARWCQESGWVVAPKLALWMSKGVVRGGEERGVFTMLAEATKGLVVAGEAARPLDAWAPVTTQLAPYLGGFRADLRARYDHAVLDGLRLRGELGATWIGRPADDPLSPLFLMAYVGADVRTSPHTRVTAGVVAWNADKHERVVVTNADGFAEVSYVRSYELWPAVDFVWRY